MDGRAAAALPVVLPLERVATLLSSSRRSAGTRKAYRKHAKDAALPMHTYSHPSRITSSCTPLHTWGHVRTRPGRQSECNPAKATSPVTVPLCNIPRCPPSTSLRSTSAMISSQLYAKKSLFVNKTRGYCIIDIDPDTSIECDNKGDT